MTEGWSLRLDAELSPGVWTDLTPYLAYERGDVTVRQGRPTEFDDPGPGVLSFALRSDAGEFMPGNDGSPFFPGWAKDKRVRLRVGPPDATVNTPITHRMTRTGSQLQVNGRAWRGAGVNCYWLALNDNYLSGGLPSYPSHATVDITLDRARAMGARIVRCHTVGNSVGKPRTIMPTLGSYDATALDQADYVIAACKARGLYLTFPFVDRWDYYHGGALQFAGFRGLSTVADFYTNATVIADFKSYISTLLNHVNPYTGVAWKNEPAIAWVETGNEVYDCGTTWTADIAAHIKSVAPNLLVQDGTGATGTHTTVAALTSPNVDIVGTHFYSTQRMDTAWLAADAATAVDAGKVMVVGEYDWTDASNNGSPAPTVPPTRATWLSALEADPRVSAAMMWAMFPSGLSDVGTHRDGFELYWPTGENAEQTAGGADLVAHFGRFTAAPYTRFTGWIQAILPDYPTDSTIGAVVYVTATDALGYLAQRELRSNLTEAVLAKARSLSAKVDVYEADPKTASNVATLTQYSPDAARGESITTWLNAPNLRFGSDQDSSFGGVASSSSPTSCKTIAGMQANHQHFWLHALAPSSELQAGTRQTFASFHTSPTGASSLLHLCFAPNGLGQNDAIIRNAADSAQLANLGQLRFGQWFKVVATRNASNNAQSDWSIYGQDGAFLGGAGAVAVDVRTTRAIEVPGATGVLAATSTGGIGGIGSASGSVGAAESFVGATNGSLSSRIDELATALSQWPVQVVKFGTFAGDVATGSWSGRPASEVLQEMMRTYSGFAFVRPRDGAVLAVERAQLYPMLPLAIVDVDGDCIGAPRLIDGTEATSSRVDVEWPGGTAPAFRADLEAGGAIRSRRIATVAPSEAVARAAGAELLTASSLGIRISQLEVDMLGPKVNHAAKFMAEGNPLDGLYPTQRLRLLVPQSHFGTPTKDVHAQGWTETYSPSQASIRMDTIPATQVLFAIESWTGSDGSGWPAQWVNGQAGTSPYVAITGNEGQLWTGTTSAVVSRRISTFTAADVEVTGKMRVFGTGDAAVYWRSSSDLVTTGLVVSFSVANGCRVARLAGGGARTFIHVVSGPAIVAGTNYRWKIRQQGEYLNVKYWAASGTDGAWGLSTTETTVWQGGYVGLGVYVANQTAYFDDFMATSGA